MADDLGVDHVGAYAEGASIAPTPSLDALAANGVLFRNAWANPTCSPTRATLLTGRYGFRTGLGQIITGNGYALPTTEFTVPEVLGAGYANAAFGKWHLGAFGVDDAPNTAGFSHFRGALSNLHGGDRPEAWFRYIETMDGVNADVDGYCTTREVDHALDWISVQTEPWFCGVFFHTPHLPYHIPSFGLHDRHLPPGPPRENPLPFFHAMMQALDHEIGRLVAGLGSAASNTLVVFVGDNGTSKLVTVAPFIVDHAKGTVFEGGINVPLLISGPSVVSPGREVSALVNTTDVYATLLEVAGVDLGAALPPGWKHDSVSLLPYLTTVNQAPLRAHAFSEMFAPNGMQPTSADRVIRDGQYKLRRTGAGITTEQMFDLIADPFEKVDLLVGGVGALSSEEVVAYQSLSQALDALLSS